jgi:hypothetical protein
MIPKDAAGMIEVCDLPPPWWKRADYRKGDLLSIVSKINHISEGL